MPITVSPAFNVLTTNSQGPSVRQLQRCLNAQFETFGILSLISVLVDGFFGPETLSAVKYFQCIGGLPVNGRVDEAVWAFATRGVAGLEVVQLGSDSTGVLAVQQAILRSQISVIADGRFDLETEQAVKVYQHRMKLVVDGVVGAQTWDQVVRSRLTDLPCSALLPSLYRR